MDMWTSIRTACCEILLTCALIKVWPSTNRAIIPIHYRSHRAPKSYILQSLGRKLAHNEFFEPMRMEKNKFYALQLDSLSFCLLFASCQYARNGN